MFDLPRGKAVSGGFDGTGIQRRSGIVAGQEGALKTIGFMTTG
jgi:hypothetical protein